MRRAFWPLIALAACSDAADTPSAPGLTVTDSTGIRIVTNAPDEHVYAELAESPVLSVGELSGPEELLFGRIASVWRDPAGNVIVADRQAYEVRIFDPRGRHLLSFGREGEGPGDFEWLAAAWPLEDGTILAADASLDRISRFDMNGRTLGAVVIEHREDLQIRRYRPGGPGMVLGYANPPKPLVMSGLDDANSMEDVMGLLFTGEANRRVLSCVTAPHTRTASPHTLAEGKQAGMASAETGNNAATLSLVPFSSESAMAISAGGIAFVRGNAYEVRLLDLDGAVHTIARIDEQPPESTNALLEAYVRGSYPSASEARWAEELDRGAR